MTKVVQEFLWAQKVQEPIALFSDWLLVGHVDEFMSFVPAPDRKVNKQLLAASDVQESAVSLCVWSQGFRLLLASPDAAYKLFRGLQRDGHGKAKLFDGR